MARFPGDNQPMNQQTANQSSPPSLTLLLQGVQAHHRVQRVAEIPDFNIFGGRNEKIGQEDLQHHGGIGAVDSEGRKDWHDWERIAQEQQRTGELPTDMCI